MSPGGGRLVSGMRGHSEEQRHDIIGRTSGGVEKLGQWDGGEGEQGGEGRGGLDLKVLLNE